MQTTYVYHQTGRRPILWIGLAIIVSLSGALVLRAAPLPAALALGLCAAAILLSRRASATSGVTLDARGLTWFHRGRSGLVETEDIDEVHLVEWPDGPDTCRVFLANGGTRVIPSACLPPGSEFARALEGRGIRAIRS